MTTPLQRLRERRGILQKVSQASVHYRIAADPTGNHCGDCAMYHTDGTCDLVMGLIAPDHVCDRWTADPKTKDAP